MGKSNLTKKTPWAHIPANYQSESTRTVNGVNDFPPYKVFSSDEAEEQIKVIQSKRGYLNPALAGADGKKPKRGKCTSILFFSDLHMVGTHLNKIKDFYRKHQKYIDNAIHLGDTMNAWNSGEYIWDIFPDAMNVIGNHDLYTQKDKTKFFAHKDNWLTPKETYDMFLKKYIANWNVVQPENAEELGKCYWHKDYNNHLRIIAIDCMRSDDLVQISWFKKTLESARKKNLQVAIITHFNPLADEFLDCNFTTIDYRDAEFMCRNDDGFNSKNFIDAIDEFIDNGGQFVSWICGHKHKDAIMYARAKHKQLVIIMEAATDFDLSSDSDHVWNTATGASWELIGIESLTNVIKIARFGNNFDHQMRHKGTFCYDFVNHKIITQS